MIYTVYVFAKEDNFSDLHQEVYSENLTGISSSVIKENMGAAILNAIENFEKERKDPDFQTNEWTCL